MKRHGDENLPWERGRGSLMGPYDVGPLRGVVEIFEIIKIL